MIKAKKTPIIKTLLGIIAIAVGFYYLFLLSTCNRNRTFVRIMEDRYPKIYQEVMEEAEGIEDAKTESQIRR